MNELTALTFGLQAFVTLLVILDPPGAAPLFLSLMGSRPRKVQVRMAWLAAATSLSIISIFAIFGQFTAGQCVGTRRAHQRSGYRYARIAGKPVAGLCGHDFAR